MPNPVLKNMESGVLIEVTKSPFVLGRGLFCDYTILNRVISRSHCQIERSGLHWILTDLSTNGTMVNDKLYITNASTILKDNDEICLSYQTCTYKFLLGPPRVANNYQVSRLRIERENNSPSPDSFDENGISDDVLNNIADNILLDGTEAMGLKNLGGVQNPNPMEMVTGETPCDEGQDIEIKPNKIFNLLNAQLNSESAAISVKQLRIGGETHSQISKAEFNNMTRLHLSTDKHNTNLVALTSGSENILTSIIPNSPKNITNEVAIEISSDEEHVNDGAEEGPTTASRSTYSQAIEHIVMKCHEQTDNTPSTSDLQISSVNKSTADSSSSYSQMLHEIVQKYTNSSASTSSIRIVSHQNGNKRLKITAKASTSLHEAGPSRVSPKISNLTSTIKGKVVLTTNHNQIQHVLHDLTTSTTECSPVKIQLSNRPEMREQLDQNAASGKSQEAETELEKASTSKSFPKQQPTKQQEQNQFEEMENELMCTICANLFIKAVTLGCSHSFCLHCIQMWKKNKSDCPICRKKITSQNNTLVLDNLVEKMIDNAPEDEKQQRKEAIEERKKIAEKEAAAKKKTVTRTLSRRGRRRASNRNNNNNNSITAPLVIQIPPVPVPAVLPVINLDELSSIDSEDSDYYNYADYDGNDWYDGVYENAYYGGYGRCYTCGNRGHWSNGCPYR